MPNTEAIKILGKRIQKLMAARDYLAATDIGRSGDHALIVKHEQLSGYVEECLETCEQELALRQAREKIPDNFLHKAQRAIASTKIKLFRREYRSFYSDEKGARKKPADPVQHCGMRPSEMRMAALSMNLDMWLAQKCASLAPALASQEQNNPKEFFRPIAQRRLLVDAMLATANDVSDLTTDWFRNRLLLRLPCDASPPQNVTWCEATDMISQSLGQGPLPAFNARLQQVENDRSLTNTEKVVQAALLMRGCFEWKAKEDGRGDPGRDNDFRLWLNNHGGAEPGEHSTMNCWEAVYFAAYKAGAISLPKLRKVYNSPTSQGDASLLGYGDAAVHRPDSLPTLTSNAGDVLFSDTEVENSKHVVLSLGSLNGQVETMSLWTFATGGTFDKAPLTAVFANNPIDTLVSVKTASPF